VARTKYSIFLEKLRNKIPDVKVEKIFPGSSYRNYVVISDEFIDNDEANQDRVWDIVDSIPGFDVNLILTITHLENNDWSEIE